MIKTKLPSVFIGLALIASVHQVASQNARFFHISGPAPSTITAFRPDGTLVWSNALPGTNYTIQTATSVSGGTNWVDYVQIPVTNGVNTNLLISFNPPSGMALIPAGSFTMGDNFNEGGGAPDAPVHSVYVSAFYMDQTDVTYSLWQQVYNWAITNGYSFDFVGYGKAANYPVQTINWFDCVKWCNARSEMEGRTPAYYTSAAQTTVYRTDKVNVDNSSVKWNAGYRLPTEAEWEKAARGGLSGQRFPWGNSISWSQANYYGDPGSLGGYAYDFAATADYDPAFSDGDSGAYPYTSPVDTFAPNGYGLYDVEGNSSQWCWDWYGTYGTGSDPRGPTSGSYRVIRGGGWDSFAIHCRSADRIINDPAYGGNPFYSNYGYGFRSVLSLGQ